MIVKRKAALIMVCKDFELIENYTEAANDKEYRWELHHKDEIRILPSGMVALRSAEYLQENDLYYHRPPDELIFLRADVHKSLHAKYRPIESDIKNSIAHKGRIMSEETKIKLSNWRKGKKLSEETKHKLRIANTGRVISDETRRKLSEIHKGKKLSDEAKRKVSEARKGQPSPTKGKLWFTDGVHNIMAYECPDGFKPGMTRRINNDK